MVGYFRQCHDYGNRVVVVDDDDDGERSVWNIARLHDGGSRDGVGGDLRLAAQIYYKRDTMTNYGYDVCKTEELTG